MSRTGDRLPARGNGHRDGVLHAPAHDRTDMMQHADETPDRAPGDVDPVGASPGDHGPSASVAPAPLAATAARSSGGRRLWALLREVLIVVVLALTLSSLVKTFLVQPFWIPSDSMNETLIRDDRVIVSKLTPGPFDLSRGDVVVFEDPGSWLVGVPRPVKETGPAQTLKDGLAWVGILPSQEDNHLIKRVIGLPGDHVQCCDAAGRVQVNGRSITEPYISPGDRPSSIPFDVHVPEGRVWVMGDHRSNSKDSRFNDTAPGDEESAALPGPGAKDPKAHTGFYGSVPIERIVGKGVAVVWPLGRVTGLGSGNDAFADVPALKVQARERTAPVATGPR